MNLKHSAIFTILIINIFLTLGNSKLIAVVEFIRHGARTPMAFMESSAKLYFGARKAQLTVNGFRQHVLLGRWLRRRYVKGEIGKLFSKKINSNEIKVYASPRQRTIFSATAHILGLLPNSFVKIEIQDKNMKNNDIPPLKNYNIKKSDGREVIINVLNYKVDYYFHALYCSYPGSTNKIKYTMKKSHVIDLSIKQISTACKDILNKYDLLFRQKQSYSSQKKHKAFQENYKKSTFSKKFFKKLIDFIRPFKYHHASYKNLDPEHFITVKKFLINKWYETRLKDSQELKISISGFAVKIIDFFENNIKQKSVEKMMIFSGHDNNIVDFLSNIIHPSYLRKRIDNALNNLDDFFFLVPRLASSLLLELHEENNMYYISIVYNGQRINNVRFRMPVKFYEKDNKVDYNDFRNLLKSRIYDGYNKLVCGRKKYLSKKFV